ncbi:hypothetical protein [Erythrobacter sp. KY5]|uniref:hypothetical protein n=1 Tax=Erythrobacter sp. KY5 TaxID=2011159 RepID=UPI0013A699EA|nr:hypothetical protein [Erythrobacter sp. KY5]
MMESNTMSDERGTMQKIAKMLGPSVGIGVFVGLIAGFYVGFSDIDLWALTDTLPSDNTVYVSALLAFAYICGGIAAFAAVSFPRHLHKLLEMEADDIADQPELFRWQGASAMQFGFAIGTLILAEPFGLLAPGIAFGIFAMFVILGIASYRKSWVMMDELMRAAASEATVIGYYLILIVGGGWAVLGHLGIAAGPDFLDIVNILWGMIILATLWTSTRRGIVGG